MMFFTFSATHFRPICLLGISISDLYNMAWYIVVAEKRWYFCAPQYFPQLELAHYHAIQWFERDSSFWQGYQHFPSQNLWKGCQVYQRMAITISVTIPPFLCSLILFSLREGEESWKNFFSLQLEHLDSRGGFVWEQNVGWEVFVRVLFVEVELSKKRLLSLIVMKAISGIWKTVSIVHFFCVHCGGFLFTRFFSGDPAGLGE